MEIKEIGKDELIKRIEASFEENIETISGELCGISEDGDRYRLTAMSTMAEGVDFDLTYAPLVHLGYKAVVKALSKITACNGRAESISVGVALSSRFSVEATEDLYKGFAKAAQQYGVKYHGGELTASLTGLTISVSAVGFVAKDALATQSGAQVNDLICVTGDLGSAYCGLKLLEREKRVLKDNNISKPKFEGYEYLLERQLKPLLHSDTVESMKLASIVPTSMTLISDSLAADLIRLCRKSSLGATLFLERIPISNQTFALCEEMHFDPTVAALNGGDDLLLLFTVPASKYQDVVRLESVDVIGHTCVGGTVQLATPDGAMIDISAPGLEQK